MVAVRVLLRRGVASGLSDLDSDKAPCGGGVAWRCKTRLYSAGWRQEIRGYSFCLAMDFGNVSSIKISKSEKASHYRDDYSGANKARLRSAL